MRECMRLMHHRQGVVSRTRKRALIRVKFLPHQIPGLFLRKTIEANGRRWAVSRSSVYRNVQFAFLLGAFVHATGQSASLALLVFIIFYYSRQTASTLILFHLFLEYRHGDIDRSFFVMISCQRVGTSIEKQYCDFCVVE